MPRVAHVRDVPGPDEVLVLLHDISGRPTEPRVSAAPIGKHLPPFHGVHSVGFFLLKSEMAAIEAIARSNGRGQR